MSKAMPARAARALGVPIVELLVIGLAGLIFGLFAGLIPMAVWRVDEFHDFGLYRTRGWSYFLERLVTWSPRPFSESIAGLYFLVEERTGRQLIEPFLAVLWASLLIGPALYLWRGGRGSVWPRLLVGAAVLCLYVVGHPVSEMFYWPMGTVAYATTLGALGALTFQVIDGRWARGQGRAVCIAAALCAAGLCEVGAMCAIYFGAAMALLHASGLIGSRRDAWAWLLPLGLGLTIMAMLAFGRGMIEEHVVYRGMSPNPTYMRHAVPSLLRTVPTYFRQLVVLDGAQMDREAFIWGAALKGAACLGLLAVFRSGRGAALPRGTRWVLGALIVGLQGTVFTSIAVSYYKFGLVCCERHDTVRQCLIVLTMLSGMALLATVLPAARDPVRLRAAGAAVLGVALSVSLVRTLPELQGAYAAWPRAVQVRQANWAAGRAPGERMILLTMTLPPLVGGFVGPQRETLRLDAKPPWLWELVMEFFEKREIELQPIGPR